MCSGPYRLIAINRSHSLGSVLRNGLKMSKPALLTRMATGPSAVSTAATAASTPLRSVISQAKACALPPDAPISFAIFCAPASSRSNTATRAPSAAKRRHVAEPIPPAPPVMMAVFPLNLVICIVLISRNEGWDRGAPRSHPRVIVQHRCALFLRLGLGVLG